MKYIKKFNEAEIGDIIQELCDNYLSYLKDLGYIIYVNSNPTNTHIIISKEDDSDINWVDIKDDFIQFICILKEEFKIHDNKINFMGYEPMTNIYNRSFYTMNVINDKVPEYATCKKLSIWISNS